MRPGKELFLRIKLKSAADLSRLEEVLVVTEKQQAAPVAESGTHVRAADILAQRLPSVPDKPAMPVSFRAQWNESYASAAECGCEPSRARHCQIVNCGRNRTCRPICAKRRALL